MQKKGKTEKPSTGPKAQRARYIKRLRERGYRQHSYWATDDEHQAVREFLARMRGSKEVLTETPEATPRDHPEIPGSKGITSEQLQEVLGSTPGHLPETPETVSEHNTETPEKGPEGIDGKPEESWYDTIFGWVLVALLLWALWRFVF